MARSAFETTIHLQLEKFGPEAARKIHIARAQRGLAEFMARQETKPSYTIEVDGRPASSETQVKPFGVIVYRFSRLREVVVFALAEARRLSPVKSGRYRDAWFVMMNDAQVALDAIPENARQILLTNDQPYSRKINVGAPGFEKYASPGIVEKVRQLILRKYRTLVDVNVEFVTLKGGHSLKSDQFRRRNGKRAGSARKDARRGSSLTYPALNIRSKFGG